MKKKFVFLALALQILSAFPVAAQIAGLQGRIVEGKSDSPIEGVHIRLTGQTDTSKVYVATSGVDGSFAFSHVQMQLYKFDATRIGLKKLTMIIQVDRANVNIGNLIMLESAIPLGEVIIEGIQPAVEQMGDTTAYNARSFKTNPDASAEELISKMPGIVVGSDGVKVGGEAVGQVLVDGKPFFGRDPTIALRNVPADLVERVQVYDKKSDQAELTGFDDGKSTKTINIVTKPDRRTTQFGKINGGYGEDSRYTASGNMNFFAGERRLTIIGLSNNVNQQNFSIMDLLGLLGSGGPQGGAAAGGNNSDPLSDGTILGNFSSAGLRTVTNFLVGQQNGISSVHSLGVNYNDSWGTNLDVSGSYFLNLIDNRNDQSLNRQYLLAQDSSSLYSERSFNESKTYNHRIDLRLQYSIDSSNSLIITPILNFRDSRSSNSATGIRSLSETLLINEARNSTQASAYIYNLMTNILFTHKFSTTGRTISVDLGVVANRQGGTRNLQSRVSYFGLPVGLSNILDQQAGTMSDGYSVSSRIAYTEPFGTDGLLQCSYNPSYTKSGAENYTYNYDPLVNEYSRLDPKLSNISENTYSTERAGIGYTFRWGELSLTTEVSYQIANLWNDQSFPLSKTIEKRFYNVLPTATVKYEFSRQRKLMVLYRTSTNPPSIGQLQDVIDNANPVLLRAGNPDLRQAYVQTLFGQYLAMDIEKRSSFFLILTASYTHNFVGNSSLIAGKDTILPTGIKLKRGTQLTVPANLDGNWMVRPVLAFGLPLDAIKSILGLHTSFGYTRTPGLMNGTLSASNVYALTQGFTLSSNFSEGIDLRLSYTANYNIAKHTLQPELDNKHFFHTASLKFDWIFWEGLTLRSMVANSLHSGLSSGLNRNYVLCNLSLGKKLLRNNRGEIQLSITDLLNQNKSINRTVTEAYVEDMQNQVLGRYAMLIFTYTIR